MPTAGLEAPDTMALILTRVTRVKRLQATDCPRRKNNNHPGNIGMKQTELYIESST